ncbi:hypothetical protein J6590_076069 [Homalodisca vitripennis]|nr:hypothetical protein J6590_076069 [Homalodisca vitripennis]
MIRGCNVTTSRSQVRAINAPQQVPGRGDNYPVLKIPSSMAPGKHMPSIEVTGPIMSLQVQ